MKIRIFDSVGNPGGGLRFVIEMVLAFQKINPELTFEFISRGQAFERYSRLFDSLGLELDLIRLQLPISARVRELVSGHWFPGKESFKKWISPMVKWHVDVPIELVEDCDVLWLPWIHWHRLSEPKYGKVVGSFHDAIILQYETNLSSARVNDERETVRQWIQSEATIVASSFATVKTLNKMFEVSTDRFQVIPLSGDHQNQRHSIPTNFEIPDLPSEFILYPANTFPHKNHELLFEAVYQSGCRFPLVITGEGTDLQNSARGRFLREFAEAHGLTPGQSLIPLGYVSDETYFFLLKRASALIMCSIAEGGGSFPVMEAMLQGKPVICSDIPVMREQLERTGGEVLWFSPHHAKELAEKLNYLDDNYDQLVMQAQSNKSKIERRSWKKVAEEYLKVFNQVSNRQGAKS